MVARPFPPLKYQLRASGSSPNLAPLSALHATGPYRYRDLVLELVIHMIVVGLPISISMNWHAGEANPVRDTKGSSGLQAGPEAIEKHGRGAHLGLRLAGRCPVNERLGDSASSEGSIDGLGF